MKICLTSDLHGHLPEIPECDILVIAGDICPHIAQPGSMRDVCFQRTWLNREFKWWCDKVPAKHIVATWGNHDFVGQKVKLDFAADQIRCTMLVDEPVEIEGLTFWGSPWSSWFHDWAFNPPRVGGDKFLATKYAMIPECTDVIISHGPPTGLGDRTADGFLTGSLALLDRIEQLSASLLVCGHIHESQGSFTYKRADGGTTQVVNASMLDRAYQPVNLPFMARFEDQSLVGIYMDDHKDLLTDEFRRPSSFQIGR